MHRNSSRRGTRPRIAFARCEKAWLNASSSNAGTDFSVVLMKKPAASMSTLLLPAPGHQRRANEDAAQIGDLRAPSDASKKFPSRSKRGDKANSCTMLKDDSRSIAKLHSASDSLFRSRGTQRIGSRVTSNSQAPHLKPDCTYLT